MYRLVLNNLDVNNLDSIKNEIATDVQDLTKCKIHEAELIATRMVDHREDINFVYHNDPKNLNQKYKHFEITEIEVLPKQFPEGYLDLIPTE